MTWIVAAAHHVLAAVSSRFPDAGRTLLQPGAVPAWDDCCDRQITVRVLGVTSLRPQGVTNRVAGFDPSCGQRWTIAIGVQVIQCVSVPDDRGRAPTPQALTQEANSVLADAELVFKTLTCDLDTDRYRVTVVEWMPLGPEGGCAGGEWRVELEVD